MEISYEQARERYPLIPERTLQSLYRYEIDHIPTGGFLKAALMNDLCETVGRADEDNLAALPQIVQFLYNEMPSPAWTNRERVEVWLGKKESK